MPRATFRFHGSLNDFLPPARRDVSVERVFEGTPAVKDTIESVGVPHPEVDGIVVNGRPVGFDRRLGDGDTVDVYPLESRPRSDELPLIPAPPAPPRFVLDAHLGRLAAYLRLLGFDAAYASLADDADLARVSHDEQRILLTRDRGLLRRRIVGLGYLLRSDDPREQLREILDRFELRRDARPFTRCIRCNGRIEPVQKSDILHLLEPKTIRYFDTFGRCDACGSIYWQGSHFRRLDDFLATMLGSPGGE